MIIVIIIPITIAIRITIRMQAIILGTNIFLTLIMLIFLCTILLANCINVQI